MKDFWNFVITIFITSVLTLIIMSVSSKIFKPKWLTHGDCSMGYVINGLYEEEDNTIELLFGGNSDTYRGIDPMVLYNDYGITSYVFVSPANRIHTAYHLLEDAYRSQKPKVYMYNVDGVYLTSPANRGNAGKAYDSMQFSLVKVKSVFDKNYKVSKMRRLSHIFPIIQYHSRYNELSEEDFKYAYGDYHFITKGLDMIANKIPYTGRKDYMNNDSDVVYTLPDTSIYYLNKMKDFCEKHNIKFVLFHVPSPDSSNISLYKPVKEYADKNNIDLIELNFNIDEIGLDFNEDTCDGGDHLNMFGASKVSKYLGRILKDKYEFTDYKKQGIWDKDYELYLKQREKEIEDSKAKGYY